MAVGSVAEEEQTPSRGQKKLRRPDARQSASGQAPPQHPAANIALAQPTATPLGYTADLHALSSSEHTAVPHTANFGPSGPAKPVELAQALLQHAGAATEALLPGSPGQIKAVEPMGSALHGHMQDAGGFSRQASSPNSAVPSPVRPMTTLDATTVSRDRAPSGGSIPVIPFTLHQPHASQPSALADHLKCTLQHPHASQPSALADDLRAAQVPMPADVLGMALTDLPISTAKLQIIPVAIVWPATPRISELLEGLCSNKLCNLGCGALGAFNFISWLPRSLIKSASALICP